LLAEDAGAEIAHAETDVEQRGDDENAQVAAKNQDRDTPRHQLLMHEDQEQGAEQELVGHGIQVLADLGLLLEQARGQAIETITESGDDKEAKRGPVVDSRTAMTRKGMRHKRRKVSRLGAARNSFSKGFRSSWLQPGTLMVHELLV
jgi:hypothetical protein